jgi:hypothetical protein
VFVETNPGNSNQASVEARKPGIPLVIGRTGLARQVFSAQ